MKHCIFFLALALLLTTSPAETPRLGWKSNPLHAKGLKQLVTKKISLPESASLEALMPPVYDQADIGSCTANAGCGAFDYQWKAQSGTLLFPSRLDLYQNALKHDGSYPQDAGSYTSTILWVLKNQGVALEKCWPYVTRKLAYSPPACAASRKDYTAVTAYDVPNNDGGYAIRQCIALKRIPVLTGGYVFNNIFAPIKDKKTGQWYVPMPSGRAVGGHEILIVGYDDKLTIAGITGWARMRNSWGPGWGDKGYAWFPQKYLFNPRYFEDNGAIQLTSAKTK